MLPSHLKEDARLDLFADPASSLYADQTRFANAFGADPVVVVFGAQPNHELLTPTHMVGFFHFEGRLHQQPGVQQVYGTGSLVYVLAADVTKEALDICGREGTAAEKQATAQAAAQKKSSADQIKAGQAAFDAAVRTCAQQLVKEFPDIGLPRPDNPVFYGQILLEPGGKQVRPFWSWALPDRSHAMVTVRLKPDATQEQVHELLQTVSSAAKDPDLKGLTVNVAGTPKLADSLAQATFTWLLTLLPLTVLAVLVVTLFVLRGVRLRWLAVPLAILSAFWCAGIAGILGLRLTPASLAVLPVVLGLGTDYALQAANRLAEIADGAPRARVAAAARSILPSTLLAAVATAAGVLAFAVSPIPLVRQFAFFMAVGVGSAWLAGVLVGIPLFAFATRPPVRHFFRRPGQPVSRPVPAWTWVARLGRVPLRAVLVLTLVGLLGWVALPFVPIETDLQHLMPAGDPAVQQALQVKQETGLAGELDLVVSGPDTSRQEVVQWEQKAGAQAVANAGGGLRLVNSVPFFLDSFSPNHQLPDQKLSAAILQNLPAYFSQAVITKDKRLARIVFGQTQLSSVQQDSDLLRRIEQIPPPPPGYTVYPAGLAVVAATALDELQGWPRLGNEVLLNVLAIALVLLVLAVAYRTLRRAVLAVLPATVAAGWATGLLWLSHVHVNPVTVLLGGVVVAFATEFSVLWLARYAEELRAGGAIPFECAAIASRRVGPAIVASAAALVLGFLLLAISPVPMVREFGLWSGADLAFATLAVLVLLPPLAQRLLPVPASRPAREPAPDATTA